MAYTPGPKLCGRCGEPQPETQDWFGEAVRMKAINADLLAALKVCADRLEANRDEWGSVRHKTEVAQARAAIEKAEGN